MAAAQGLGYLGDKRALPDLEWAKENDPHQDEHEEGYCVHRDAAEAIARIKARFRN